MHVKYVNNLSIKLKLALMITAPVIGLFYYSQTELFDAWTTLQEQADLENLTQISIESSALMHELQKERGASAGYMASKGKNFTVELPAQRQVTDRRLAKFNQFILDFESGESAVGFEAELTAFQQRLASLAEIRSSATRLSVPAKQVIGYYTNLNNRILALIDYLPRSSSLGIVSNMGTAYGSFLKSKERAGIERAVMSAVFARDKYNDGEYDRLLTLKVIQATYLNEFEVLASEAAKNHYDSTVKGRFIAETDRMKRIAKKQSNDFGVEATYWFKMQTGKINLLKEVEDSLSKELQNLSHELTVQAKADLSSSVIITLAAFLISGLLAFLIQRYIVRSLNIAVTAAGNISNGDLECQIPPSGNDELGQLLNKMREMVEILQHTIDQVRAGSQNMETASQEVSATSQMLSQGTSEQAAGVEATSASIEQINESVQQNAENAKVTESKANLAAEQADEGGKAVASTVNAMEEIVDKISVIEDIAYQTNLLSLNAAIEAARAGEHGKGFAVVATEVRNLAENSRMKAQEIREMAAENVAIAKQAGKLVEEIVPSIGNTATLVHDIAEASKMQASNVGQINQTMSQLDQLTQQSASSSEELAATAEQMKAESKHLSDAVAFFKLDSSDLSHAGTRASVSSQPSNAKPEPVAMPSPSSYQQNTSAEAKANPEGFVKF